jgi:hypothetical protein
MTERHVDPRRPARRPTDRPPPPSGGPRAGLGRDDVEWVIHGHRTSRGQAEFDGEIENPAFSGSPQLDVQRIYEDGSVVVTTGEGPWHER